MEDLKKNTTPEEKPAQPAPIAIPRAPATVKRQYIGPDYRYGIVLPGTTQQIDPKRMTEKEINDLIAIYPEARGWWK